jgi:Lipopolysaccharide-assembly
VPIRRLIPVILLPVLALVGCESGGHFTFLGYTTKPNYDVCIKTVYVPIFHCEIMLDEPRRQIPFDLTRAVIREIESKTPYKVISDPGKADTQLTGTVISLTKSVINRNPLNEIREAQTVLTVGIVWKDLRSGEYLSKQRKAPGILATPGIPALDIPDLKGNALQPAPTAITLPAQAPMGFPGSTNLNIGRPADPDAAPVLVTGLGDYIPELGQSTSTAYQQAINKIATEIVSLMEKPW